MLLTRSRLVLCRRVFWALNRGRAVGEGGLDILLVAEAESVIVNSFSLQNVYANAVVSSMILTYFCDAEGSA